MEIEYVSAPAELLIGELAAQRAEQGQQAEQAEAMETEEGGGEAGPVGLGSSAAGLGAAAALGFAPAGGAAEQAVRSGVCMYQGMAGWVGGRGRTTEGQWWCLWRACAGRQCAVLCAAAQLAACSRPEPGWRGGRLLAHWFLKSANGWARRRNEP